MTDPAPYFGTTEPLRDAVADCLDQVRFNAGMAVECAASRDDAALTHFTRRATIALRHAISVLRMLEERNAADLASRLAARAQRDGADTALGL